MYCLHVLIPTCLTGAGVSAAAAATAAESKADEEMICKVQSETHQTKILLSRNEDLNK